MLVGFVDRFCSHLGRKGRSCPYGASGDTGAPPCVKFKSGNSVHSGFSSSETTLLMAAIWREFSCDRSHSLVGCQPFESGSPAATVGTVARTVVPPCLVVMSRRPPTSFTRSIMLEMPTPI